MYISANTGFLFCHFSVFEFCLFCYFSIFIKHQGNCKMQKI